MFGVGYDDCYCLCCDWLVKFRDFFLGEFYEGRRVMESMFSFLKGILIWEKMVLENGIVR